MSYDPDFERRINNKLETIIENQAEFDVKMKAIQEAITGLIQVARLHNEQLDELRRQTEENSRLIAELREQGRAQDERHNALRKEQDERLNALIRIVEGHVSNHP